MEEQAPWAPVKCRGRKGLRERNANVLCESASDASSSTNDYDVSKALAFGEDDDAAAGRKLRAKKRRRPVFDLSNIFDSLPDIQPLDIRPSDPPCVVVPDSVTETPKPTIPTASNRFDDIAPVDFPMNSPIPQPHRQLRQQQQQSRLPQQQQQQQQQPRHHTKRRKLGSRGHVLAGGGTSPCFGGVGEHAEGGAGLGPGIHPPPAISAYYHAPCANPFAPRRAARSIFEDSPSLSPPSPPQALAASRRAFVSDPLSPPAFENPIDVER
ncbi:hypothetical protein DIPPA_22860 [Diplonema papillatum]|nr:hypothetical protein DIPPA_22860 [Diplonema papillatum]